MLFSYSHTVLLFTLFALHVHTVTSLVNAPICRPTQCHQISQILTFASGNTKKPKVKGGRVTFDPGSRWTGLKAGSSVSLDIIRRCLPFSITYLNTHMITYITTTTTCCCCCCCCCCSSSYYY